MKKMCCWFLCLVFALGPALAQESHRKPLPETPPEAARQPARPAIDPVRLQREADELASLASSIPQQIDQVKHGLMPKDLDDKLRRIEKLSKQLRKDLSP